MPTDAPTPTPAVPPHGASARRLRWDALPDDVRAAVEQRLGSAVVEARSQDSGFTDGLASRVTCADGTRAFVKAIDGDANAVIADSYRQEARVAAALPDGVPAPRLLWSCEHGPWVLLAFEDVAGRTPARPWRADELAAVLDALPALAAHLTPCPPALDGLPSLAQTLGGLRTWRDHAATGALPPGVGPAWHARLDELAALEADVVALADGDTATHFDLRDDNVLLADDGRVLVCDWNWLSVGAPWLDLVGLLVSAHGDGHDADALLAAHPLGRDAPARGVDAFLATLGGYFATACRQPGPSSSPWLRPHQAWWRDASLGWLADRLDRRPARTG